MKKKAKRFIRRIKKFVKRKLGKTGAKSSAKPKTGKAPASAASKQDAVREKHIQSIMAKSGWTHGETIKNVKEAKTRLNITYRDYDIGNFHSIPASEQQEKLDELIRARKERDELRAQRVLQLEEKTGWSHEKADAALKAARKLGIGAGDYIRFELYNCPESELTETLAERRKSLKSAKKSKKKESLLQTVMSETGWDRDTAERNMKKSFDICGAEYKDYVAYRFWEKSDEVQKTYFTKGDANALRLKYNAKEDVSCFMNKCEFNEIFSEFLGRPWAYSSGTGFDEFKRRFSGERKIMYKPLQGSCGKGITAYEISDDNIGEVWSEISALPDGIVEGYITQHHEMAKYSLNAVNTVRVVTVRKNGKVDLMYAAFRMAGGDAVVDNFHHGGVLALIDTDTGVVTTDAFRLDGTKFEDHPTTGEKVRGFVIPYWKEITEMLKKAGTLVKGIGYIGWDVAVTENGPVLIEGNTAPAPCILQIPKNYEGKGMKHVAEKYL